MRHQESNGSLTTLGGQTLAGSGHARCGQTTQNMTWKETHTLYRIPELTTPMSRCPGYNGCPTQDFATSGSRGPWGREPRAVAASDTAHENSLQIVHHEVLVHHGPTPRDRPAAVAELILERVSARERNVDGVACS